MVDLGGRVNVGLSRVSEYRRDTRYSLAIPEENQQV